MKRFLKLVLLVAFVAGIAALVTAAKSKKQMIAGMSDDEIRAYIDQRLASRVPPEKLEQIQDAVVQGTANMRGAATTVADEAEEAADQATDAADEAAGESDASS